MGWTISTVQTFEAWRLQTVGLKDCVYSESIGHPWSSMFTPNLKNSYCGLVKPQIIGRDAYRRLGLPPPAKEVSDLKKSLELLMKEAQVPGDLSGFPLEEAAWC